MSYLLDLVMSHLWFSKILKERLFFKINWALSNRPKRYSRTFWKIVMAQDLSTCQFRYTLSYYSKKYGPEISFFKKGSNKTSPRSPFSRVKLLPDHFWSWRVCWKYLTHSFHNPRTMRSPFWSCFSSPENPILIYLTIFHIGMLLT